MERNKVELLSPAGNMNCLKAAISNGANAIYLGGKNFSARAFAGNFSHEEIIEAVQYAHLRNVKIYITINTLLNEKELENAKNEVQFYYENKVDALLIQDLGLYYYIKQKYPDFELHCSTQMHVHNIQGIQNAKKLGFKRVVIPRESSLDFVKEACKQDIEIETFVHGAICVSYSGQCLISSVTKNRSANKGTCSQCCRLRYKIFDKDNNQLDLNTDYPLSTKDMCLIHRIPELIQAGVSSLKIEGRMKSVAYVGYVTRLYRQALDAYYNHQPFALSQDQIKCLKVLFNRDFTDAYLDNHSNLFGQKTPNHLGIPIGKTISYRNGHLYIQLEDDLNQFDGIRIGDYGCILNYLYKDGLLTNSAKKGDIVSIKVDKMEGIVYKTLDSILEKQLKESVDRKIPLILTISLYPNKEVTIKANVGQLSYPYSSNIVPQIAQKKALGKETIKNQFSKLGDTCYYLESINIDTKDSFLPVSSLNEIRRDLISKLNEYRLNSFKREVISTDLGLSNEVKNEVKGDPIGVSIEDNLIINPNSLDSHGITYQFGDLLNIKNHILFYSMNCMNSYCYEFFKRLGYDLVILSSEIKENEVNDLIQAYHKRLSLECHPYLYISGSRTLMFIKGNIFDNKYPMGVYTISDGNNDFDLIYRDNLYQIREKTDSQLIFESI